VQVSASELWIGAPQWQRHYMRCARDDSMIELAPSTSLLAFAGKTMNTWIGFFLLLFRNGKIEDQMFAKYLVLIGAIIRINMFF